jgi:hypothetical protein
VTTDELAVEHHLVRGDRRARAEVAGRTTSSRVERPIPVDGEALLIGRRDITAAEQRLAAATARTIGELPTSTRASAKGEHP